MNAFYDVIIHEYKLIYNEHKYSLMVKMTSLECSAIYIYIYIYIYISSKRKGITKDNLLGYQSSGFVTSQI